ncbi:MAG TPA: hypothetical protein VN611_02935 [Patescibacteria group bacterium]|nr:hypothetical protein [Patescibacteria group bacterium]
MNLYRLGAVPGIETQAIYHTLAQQRQEGLIICRPSTPCVCLGMHDDLMQEVDIRYCTRQSLPIIRREIGGGLVLLDRGQVFFQLVLRSDNPCLQRRRDSFFCKFLLPAVRALADFGLQAKIQTPADIVVNERKISGNGAGDLNGFAVFTGNVLLNFDRLFMSRVLRLPGRRFRELTRWAMERHLTTMAEELGYEPEAEQVEERLIVHFSDWLGKMEPVDYSDDLRQAVEKVVRQLTDPEFLRLPGKRRLLRQVKINEKTYVRLQPIRECLADNPGKGNECRRENGGLCQGQLIAVVQNGRLVSAEFHQLCRRQRCGLDQLAQYLHSVRWYEPDIRRAVADWNRDLSLTGHWIDETLMMHWLLAE